LTIGRINDKKRNSTTGEKLVGESHKDIEELQNPIP
jgi:hypothetical protein